MGAVVKQLLLNVTLVSVLSVLSAGSGQAATELASFVRLSGTVAQGTAVFRADLTGLSFGEILSITLIDSNSMSGGSRGQYSGFDLDAIKLSRTLATTAAQASSAVGLTVFDYAPTGTFLTPGSQRPPVNTKLNGTDPSGQNVDPVFATLDAFDAVFFGTGSVTLGDGGQVSFNLTSPVGTSELYLYIGEVSGDLGEGIAGTLFVSSAPVPEPSSAALVMLGIAAMVAHRYRVAKKTMPLTA